MHQQSSELLCNWTATSSPNMSEIDDNENDAGFGRSIPGLASGVYNDDSFEAIPDDLKNVEAFGRQNSYGNVGNCNGNGSQAYRPSPSNFRVKDEPHNPTGARMSQDFGFQEDSSMQIHHDLMFRRIMQDIFTTCSSLCLPTDPSQWTVDHCNNWISEMCQQFHYPRPNRINVIGKDLINMSVNQMNRLIPNGGDQIHAQFQVWRIAFDSYQSQHPCQPTTATPTHHNMHMPMSTSLMSTPPPVPTATDFLNTYNPDATQNGFYNNMNKFGDDMNNMTKFREDNMKYNEMAKYNEQNKYNEYSMVKNEYYEHNQMPQEIYSPSASSSESITDDETQHDLQFEHHEGQGQVPMCVPQQMMSYQQQCQQRFSYMNVTPQHSHFQQPNFMQHHQFPAPAQPDFNAKQGINQANSGRTVHLWHFIKELLENPTEYSTCVRWVDREEGTFKIESSMQLARYWGIRKHREKMNYDKLSRSLRQYYKKGIIQKPEKKQRLVYKFLPPYSHWRPQLS